MGYQHLHESVVDIADQDVGERLAFIQRARWIGYPRAQGILKKMESLLRHPTQARMPSMLIIARSNNGKTMLVERFCKKHPPNENLGGEHILVPVLYVEAPPTPSEAGLYSEILERLYEKVPSGSVDAKRNRVVEVLRNVENKVLVIDEMHNLLAGASVRQQGFLNVIKYISNTLRISIVGCGTEDLLRAVSIDNQIVNRFPPEILPLWQPDNEFRQLMKSFESILPLRERSGLEDKRMMNKILAMSEGTIGEVSTLINKASAFVLEEGRESITIESLEACGYVPPSDRSKVTARI